MSYIDNFELRTTATIKRIVYVNDGMGGNAQTTQIIDKIKCAFWMNGSNENFVSDRVHNPGTYSIACSPSTQYLESDKVIIKNSTCTMTRPDNVSDYDELMIIGLNIKG